MQKFLSNIVNSRGGWYQLMWYVFITLLCLSLTISISVLGALLAGYDVNALASQNINDIDATALNVMKLLQVLTVVGIFMLPAIIFAYIKTADFSYLQLKFPISLAQLGLTVVIMGLAFAAIMPIVVWNNQIGFPESLQFLEDLFRGWEDDAMAQTKAFLNMNNPLDLIINLMVVAVAAAVTEELCFRGILQQLFQKISNNAHAGIWIAGILFSLIHFQFYGFVPRMLLGVLFGYLFYWSGNLWIPIWGHFLNNGVQVLVVYFVPEQLESAGTPPSLEPAMLIGASLAAVLLFFSLQTFYKLSAKNTTIANNNQ